MLVAQLSDTHLTAPGDQGRYGDEKLIALERCIEDINNLDTLPDVVIHTGDLSDNGSYEELLLTKKCLDKLVVPYYVTPGNKDCADKVIEVFTEQLNGVMMGEPITYLVDNLPIKLASLDTTTPLDNRGLLDYKKIAAIDKILCMNQNDPVIIFSHHPPFNLSSDTSPHFEFVNKGSIKIFDELVDRHSQIVALLCGHFHRPIRKSMGLFDANIAPPVCNLIDYSSNKAGPNHIGNFQLHKFGQGNEFTTEVKMISN
jgi:3',5'-cyclic AMP phosphodiesterase CpdA